MLELNNPFRHPPAPRVPPFKNTRNHLQDCEEIIIFAAMKMLSVHRSSSCGWRCADRFFCAILEGDMAGGLARPSPWEPQPYRGKEIETKKQCFSKIKYIYKK